MNVDLQELFAKEHEGAIGEAYAITHSLLEECGSPPELLSLLESNAQRLKSKVKRLARSLDWSAMPVFEHASNPRTYQAGELDGEFLPIVTLTTISERLTSCLEVIKSIAAAKAPVHSINLYISNEPFLIDRGVSDENALLERIHEAGANVYRVKNTGPYRKMVPLIFQLREAFAPDETPILTVDDDVDYPADAWDRMFSMAQTNEAVIAHRGRRVATSADRISSYQAFTVPDGNASFADLPNGRNGVLYRLKHFGTGPEHFAGSILAPTADDLWAKCSTLVRGVPVIILEPTAMDDVSLDYPEMFPEMKTGLFHNYNAKGGNDQAFRALEAFYSDLIETPIAKLINLEVST